MASSEPKRELDWRTLIPAVLVIGGILLILGSLLLPTSVTGRAGWSPEQAKKYQEAAVKLHSLSHASLHTSPEADQPAKRKELQQAEADYNAIRSQLDSAIARPKKITWAIRLAGVALVAIGGFGLYHGRAPA
jgi:hypothetical protein